MSSDDWQETAFNTRHMHNRQARGSRSSKSNTTFDVRKTFGSYEIKCAAWQKLEHVSTDSTASLELYRLTENGLAVVGQLFLPGAFTAAVLLAGSRESLRRTLEELDEDDEEEEEAGADANANPNAEQQAQENDPTHSSADEQDPPTPPSRFETFEKNSFRTPKFWLKWNAAQHRTARSTSSSSKKSSKKNFDVKQDATDENDGGTPLEQGSGTGYIVFTGNACKKFKGTISCEQLGWRDVALAGHKEVGRSESDVPVFWGRDVGM